MSPVTIEAPRRKRPLSKEIVVSPKPPIHAFVASPPAAPPALPPVRRYRWLVLCRAALLIGGVVAASAYSESRPDPVRRSPDVSTLAHYRSAMEEKWVEPLRSPLVFDLDGSGLRTTEKNVRFDLAGDGKPWRISGIGEGNGLLVFDADGDGRLGASGRELLGNLTDLNGDGKPEGFADGFEALKAMAARAGIKHAVLDKDDLALLEERFGLAIRRGGVEGKVLTLKEAGVASLALPTGKGVRARDFDGRGNDLERAEGAVFTRTDGTKGAYADLWFRNQPDSAVGTTTVLAIRS